MTEPSDREPLLGSPEQPSAASPSRRKRRWLRITAYCIAALFGVIFLVLLIFVLISKSSVDPDADSPPFVLPPPSYPYRNPSYLVRGRRAAVATEEPLCSEIGLDVLRENGTATDAAIASSICVGTLNMFSSGIGGGGFAVLKPPPDNDSQLTEGGPVSIDFRETAPAAADVYMFNKASSDASRVGGLAVAVPGELAGAQSAYNMYGGGVSWSRLFEPSIKLAQEGWLVSAELERRLALFGGFMLSKDVWREIFAPDSRLVRKGDTIKRPAYGTTLQTIADHGADAFYNGDIPKALVKSCQAEGGVLTVEDFASYKPIIRPALKGSYRNRTIYTTHAPSAGPVLLSLLNTLEPLDLVESGRTPLNVHRFVEALKYAFSHRTRIGDPAFSDVQGYLDEMITKSFGHKTLANISDEKTFPISHYNPLYDTVEDHGTTHISVVDENGGSAAWTTTVNLLFGSQVMDRETGVILNDEMDDFSVPNTSDAFGLRPSPYNYPFPGARPLSSTSAAIFDDPEGNIDLVIGGSGGSRIFSSISQVVLNLDWGYDLTHAVEEPRIHHQLLPAEVSVETEYPDSILDELKRRGHNVTLFDINLGIAEVQAVKWDREHGWLYAASDSRKHGRASAF